ncbi:MAG: hypothetical protein AMXMBFR4_30930 [Candidatus Hydrogenedentota bacterium]
MFRLLPGSRQSVRGSIGRGFAAFTLVCAVGDMGCAHLPQDEFAAYIDSFEAIESIVRELLADYGTAKRGLAQTFPDRTDRYPVVLDVSTVLDADAGNREVAARLAALEGIAAYNGLLIALSDGRSPDEMRQQADTLRNVLESLEMLALSPPLSGELLTEVIEICTRARDRARFLAIVERGAPLIDSILDVFVQDVENLYGVRVAVVGLQLNRTRRDIASAKAALDHLAALYAPPPAGTELSRRRSHVESEANRILAVIAPGSEAALPAGSAPYDEGAQASLDAQLSVLRGLAANEQALVDSINAYHSALLQYVELLRKTRVYLTALRLACTEKPVAAKQTEIVALGQELNGASGELLATLRTTRAAVIH